MCLTEERMDEWLIQLSVMGSAHIQVTALKGCYVSDKRPACESVCGGGDVIKCYTACRHALLKTLRLINT